MAQLSPSGKLLLGKDSTASVDGQVISPVRCSVVCWLTDTVVIGQFLFAQPDDWRICTLDLSQPNPQLVPVGGPAGFLYASGGTWAAMATTAAGIFGQWSDGSPIAIAGARPWNVNEDGSELLYTVNGGQNIGLAQMWRDNGAVFPLYSGQIGVVATSSKLDSLWTGSNGAAIGYPDTPKTIPLVNGTRFCTLADGSRYIVQNSGNKLVVYPWGQDATVPGYILSTDGKDYNPAILAQPDGVLIGSSETQGERSTDGRLYQLDLAQNRLRKASTASGAVVWGDWAPIAMVPLAPTGPIDPPSGGPGIDASRVPPQKPLITFPGFTFSAASYGRPGYCGPYYDIDVRNIGYGADPATANFKTPGNCSIIAHGTVIAGNQQVDRPVFMYLDCAGVNEEQPDKFAGFVAWANVESMSNEGTKTCRSFLQTHGHPKVEIVRYYDATPMPDSFIDSAEKDAILEVQAYRRKGESIADFIARVVESLDRIERSGRRAGIARMFNVKYSDGLAGVLEGQGPLCDMIRPRPFIVGDWWFSWSRWFRNMTTGVVEDGGAAFHQELITVADVLGGLFTGLP